MKKIKVIHFSYLRNEAHYEFLVQLKELIVRFSKVKEIVTALYAAFIALLEQEEKLVDAIKTSDYTKKIAEADQRVDRDLVGIKDSIAAALHHFDPAVAEAAQSLHNLLKTYGKVGSKSYEEEVAAVNLLLVELNGTYASKVTLIGITPWVTELAAAIADFEQLFDLRNTERAGKPQQRLKDVRREIEAVYHLITTRVDAATTLNDDEAEYGEFIDQLNAEITYFNEHTHRHAKKDIKAANVADIAPQPFAGKPVVVIPTVHYTEKGETKELIFAKDFNVTYKDNDRVGTATLTIHGKGGYKGQKVVTFNIM